MTSSPHQDFEKNIFINCPFDTEYLILLQPILFTILYFGFNPKIAFERSDSGEQRIDKICKLIEISKFSIHDLSRLQAMEKDEFYRLNMPFELGIDYGIRKISGNFLKEKKFLILEKDKYNYPKALSDLSGVDIKNHNNDASKVIRAIRNWFIETVKLKQIKPASVVWDDFNFFMADFDKERKNEGYKKEDIYNMPIPEFVDFVKEWIER